MNRGLPWWAIVVQAPATGLVMLVLIASDYVIATVRWAAFADHPGTTSSGGGSVIGVLLLPIILGIVSLIVGMPILVWAAIGTLLLLVVGLPLRVIPAAGDAWLRWGLPWVLGVVGAITVALGWMLAPVPAEPPVSYLPSTPLFAIGLALTGFAVAHLWLPRRDRLPRDRQLAQAPA